MSHPDYEQYSQDHAALLVLVRHIGSQLKINTFNKFYERINKINSVRITDSTGQIRTICVRYVREYPVENNDWGDFQTHRRLLGLISLGKYDSQQELNEICRVHESLKVKYTSTLYDSRCILFKPESELESPASLDTNTSDQSLKCDSHNDKEESSSEVSSISETCERAPSSSSGDQAHKEKVDKLIEKLREERIPDSPFTTPSNFKTRAMFYSESEPTSANDLEAQLSEFINSLFWVLESKRLERSREKLERVSLLLAPFEKKDFVGLDMESRNNKKRCTGRVTKHLGDLCLQAGLAGESLAYYSNAADTLKSVNDWLWLGAAYEGLCAASALLLYPHMQRTSQMLLHRNSSLQECSPRKSSAPTSPSSDTNTEATAPLPAACLSADDIPKRYREAIIHYSKYQNAGIVETEASFKAARISVEQNHSLQAASFLQNVVFINLTLSEQEKIARFETLSDLYTQIGFTRKAAFCHRLAASRYVSAQNPTPNWTQCYNLMLQSFPGHKLTMDPTEMCGTGTGGDSGWPNLQIHLLQELVVAAKRMGHSALATRHMTFLLQTMWRHLTRTDQKELAIQLQCEGAPVPLVLDSGVVIPPANLTNIPLCAGFTLKNLPPHLMPKKIVTLKHDCGPFLFTPINFGSLERKSDKPQSKMEFLWVEDDPCEVRLKLVNPLPFELKVSNMRLLTAGVVFESMPETVLLPPTDTNTALTLNGSPKESGELELFGYSTHALGVKSNCRLKHMPHFLPHYSIEVIPKLPVLEVKTSLPQSATFSTFQNFENVVTSGSLTLYNGESGECVITLTNTSQVPVHMMEVSIQSALDPALQHQIFSWSQEELEAQLPLLPTHSATLRLHLYSAANFLASTTVGEFSSGAFGSSHAGGSSIMSMSAGPTSLPSRLNSPVHSAMGGAGGSFHSRRHDQHNSSFRSSNSGQSSMTTQLGGGVGSSRSPGLLALPQHAASQLVEGQLQIRYSGGGGLEAGYCRTCSVFLTLEMLPSLQVTNWDVLPAETSSQFYLVLDVANLTSQEMELQYTAGKRMLIEGHESCRVPVPVDRCPLSKLSRLYMHEEERREQEEVQVVGEERLPRGGGFDSEKICSEHIAQLADLRWQLMATDTRGRATLKGITLTADMLDIVRMSPLLWDVSINGERVTTQDGVSCEAGDCLEVCVRITNSLQRALRHLTMSVLFYQDYQSASGGAPSCNYRLETRLATTGPNKVLLASLESLEKAEHAFNVLFFTPGQYKMDIKVVAAAEQSSSAAAAVAQHIWRFIPPIQINVHL